MGAVVTLVSLLLFASSAAHTAGQSVTITCFYTVPTAPGQRPAATPLVFKRKDGFEVCMRYQYRCSLSNPACLAHEAQSGTLKWHYLAASKAGCLSIAAAATRASGVRNVLCCSTNRCNIPDRTRDKSTQIIQDSWLSRSTNRPASKTVTLAQAPPPGQAVLQKRSEIPAAISTSAAPTPATAVGSVKIGGSDGNHTSSLDDDHDDLQLHPQGFNQLTTCLYGPLPQSSTVISTSLQPGMDTCARYEYKCTTEDTSCTATEVKDGRWIWTYIPTSKKNCQYLKTLSIVRNVFCCDCDNCNAIDAQLDPKSHLQPTPTVAVTATSSDNSTNHQLQQLVASGSSPAITSASITSSSMISKSNSTQDSITCYISYPTAPSQNVTGDAAVYSAHFSKMQGYEMCVRYLYKCSVAAGTCTSAEVRNGVWKVGYSVLSEATCAQMSSRNGPMYRKVTCCDQNNCNQPDKGTQVLPPPVLYVVA